MRNAVSRVDPVNSITTLINAAMTEIGVPATSEDAREAAEIARQAIVFLHDRALNPDPHVAHFMEWITTMVEDDDLQLPEAFLLLLEAIDSGKRDQPHGVISAAGRVLTNASVNTVLDALSDAPTDNSGEADLAAVHLRSLAEYVRALRLIPESSKAFDESVAMAGVLERFEAHAGKLSAFAIYRARLAVAYALRDVNGRWDDAGLVLARARKNRERDGRTRLTDGLHQASAERLEGATIAGGWCVELSEDIIANARALEDRCLSDLRAAGFHRHERSFRRFRSRYLDPT